MKRISAFTLTMIVIACSSTVPATAGPTRSPALEGFIIGTGVALIGTAIIHSMKNEKQCAPHSPGHKRADCKCHQRLHARYDCGPRGHWEIQKVWVEDKYKKRWNPGHYTPRGHWKNGRHERFLVQKGHWETQRVWIATKHKHR